MKWAARGSTLARWSSGHITVSSTSWIDLDTGLDLTLAALSGDKIEVAIDGFWNNDAVTGYLDVATIVSGSPVTYFSNGTGTQPGNGISGWRGQASVYIVIGGPSILTLGAGDVSGGNVVLRMRTKTSAGSTRSWLPTPIRS